MAKKMGTLVNEIVGKDDFGWMGGAGRKLIRYSSASTSICSKENNQLGNKQRKSQVFLSASRCRQSTLPLSSRPPVPF